MKGKNILKYLLPFGYYLLLFTSVTISIITILSTNPFKLNYSIFSVQSGSMKPTIYAGDLIVTKEEKDYQKNDIITFNAGQENGKSIVITHRIVGVKDKGFQTKGDFNSVPDIDLVEKEDVIGKYLLRIPLLGYPTSFAKTVPGFMILIVIPATVIIYDEINKIKEEINNKKKRET